MPHEITHHKCPGLNEAIKIKRFDEPGSGGAYAGYSFRYVDSAGDHAEQFINFQVGTVAYVGVNGITNEAALAVVIDRLECFQAGKFPCAENAEALDLLYAAMRVLHSRTKGRIERGVEGINVK